MNWLKHSKRANLLLGVAVMSMLVAAANPVFGKNIRVIMAPSNTQPAKGEQITVALDVDVSDFVDQLGSYSAQLRWNPQALKFVGCTGGVTAGFAKPVVNQRESAQGHLIIAHAQPLGARGKVNILNLTFEVLGATGGSDLNVEFTAMAAAYTFENLLPKLASVFTGVKDEIKATELPKTYSLLPNLPNPFNAYTEIQYSLPAEQHVVLTVFNVLGQKIKTLVNGTAAPGKGTVRWDGTDATGKKVPAGIYVYRIEVNGFVDEKKMILIR